jgi:hypothetical protein
MSHSTQALIRVGKLEDLYYADEDNTKVESVPVSYNTRYTQNMNNLSAGTNVFTIPPGNGLKHVVIVLGYNASTINGQLGAQALPRGWGYKALSLVSFRVGGSSQYFMTGEQLLNRALMQCRTQTQRDAILSLGGNECKVASDFDVDQFAYIVVPIWCSPSADGLNVPLPADLLSQQVQVTAQLAPASSWWTPALGGVGAPAAVALPTAFDVGYFQVEQLIMNDRGMSLSNKANLDEEMYTMPLVSFSQQELTFPLAASASDQQITLTGFRSGECRKIVMWMTKDSDAANSIGLWYSPKNATILYAGEIFAQYNNGVGQLFNLLDSTAPSLVSQSALSPSTTAGIAAGTAFTSAPQASRWLELPFGTPTGCDYEAEVLAHGKEILNGVVNAIINTGDAASAYTLHVQYIYNASITFSRGSADFIF